MGFLAGLLGGGHSKTVPIAAAGLQMQSSTQGLPVTLLFGTNKVAPNLIWYNDFQAIAQQSSGGGGGGKGGVGGGGGGKGGGGSTSYLYQAAFQFGLCDGPIRGVGQVYVNKQVTSLSSLGYTLFTGSYSQDCWGYLITNHVDQTLNYRGLAHIDNPAFQMGNSPQIPNHNVEVFGRFSDSTSTPDADPSLVIPFLLSDPKSGCRYPASQINSLGIYQAYCIAQGLLVSPVYTQQTACSSMVSDLLAATNSAAVFSSGMLSIVPYGDKAITANGYTYTPPSSPIYDVGDDDFAPQNGSDPVYLNRVSNADVYNSIQLECLDRANQYNPAVVSAKDQALIDMYGLNETNIQAHYFADLSIGRLSAQLQLQRQTKKNTYSFTLDHRFVFLDPMDIISITCKREDGTAWLTNQWVRIISIDEDSDGNFAMTAEEYLDGSANAPLFNFETSSGYAADYNSDPGNANPPVIFEPPMQIAQSSGLEADIACSGGTNWGGCDIWISADGDSYKHAGRVTGKARQGVLSSSLSSGVDPDTANTLRVDMSQSEGVLTSGTKADADNNHTLCYVDGEYISYQTATLTGVDSYDLTYLRRGQYGSTISAHASGTPFARMDGGIFAYDFDKSQIGLTIYIKLLSFNIFGGGVQSLADVDPYTHVLKAPPPPGQVLGFGVGQEGDVVAFDWIDLTNDFGLKGYDIAYGAPGSAWSSKEVLTEAHRGTEMTNASVPPGTWEFSIRGRDLADQLSPVISSVTLIVVNNDTLIFNVPQESAWGGALSGFVYHYTGVLIPQSQFTPAHYIVISPPSAPTLSQIIGGSLTAATYYVKITYVDSTGETVASSQSSLAVLIGGLLVVASPPTTAQATGWNVYASTSTGTETLQNASPIGIGANWTEPTSGLISGASPPSNNSTGMQVFNKFVPDPVTTASYTSATIDGGYDDSLRVYASDSSTLGPGETGAAAMLQFQIDTWLSAGSDTGIYYPWNIGFVNFRYLNARIVYSGITEGNVSYVTDFTPTADKAPVVEESDNIVIAPGGTTVTFAQRYHQPPFVVATAISSSPVYATASMVTATDCLINVWDTTGTSVGGTVNYTSKGE